MASMEIKVLITGVSGYFGKLLTEYLISRNIPVVGIDIRENAEKIQGHYRFYNCSVVEKEKLQSIFSEECPTHVLHFACSFNKIREKKREYLVDITGSENVLEVSNNTLSVKQLIFSSSAAAYGGNRDNKEWLVEEDPLRPGKYRYGLNKKTIESIFFGTPLRSGLKVISLRICTVVGPMYDKPKSIVSLLIRFPYLPVCCKNNRLQFIHSDDMVNLFGQILEDREISGIFNLASDSFVFVNDLLPGKRYVRLSLSIIKSILWILWNLKLLNLQPAAVKDAIYPIVLNPSKIASRYHYIFKYSSKEAFQETVIRNMIPAESRF
jgi:nucleoside-diphosphate-sugar epimerase